MKSLIIFALLMLILPSFALEVKVGVYDNPPLVSRQDSKYEGLYIDLIEHIAEKEGWKIIYVYDTFPNLLRKLENGEIDLMTAIAYSEEREKLYKFTNETILSNWGLIVSKDRYNSILEMKGLRVAGLLGDVYTESFKKLSNAFELNCEILELEGEYKDVLKAVRDGLADAGIVSRIYGSLYAKDYGLEITNVIFSPISLRFASKNKELLSIIDRHVSEMKADSSSIYYQSLEKWFGVKSEIIPSWIYQLALAGALVICLLIFGNILLGREVRRRSKKIEEALNQYEYLWENANDILYIHDLNGDILKINRKALELFGYESSLGVKFWDVVDPKYRKIAEEKLKEILESKKFVGPYEILCRAKDGREIWLEIISHPIIKDGEVVAIHGIARDITERKKLLEQLEKNILLIAHLVDKIRNPLTVARVYCELSDEFKGDTNERVINCIDTVIDLLSDLEKAWIESERLRDLLFGWDK
ncbi:MAG: hypothetical protein PWQ22_241 [Archaeoglobaceae archaeon]|nr:hypothetical protein [Archaeoglobaceae archaeon]